MKHVNTTRSTLPRLFGSLLVTVMVATQTLPATAQPTATNPPAKTAKKAPAPAPATPVTTKATAPADTVAQPAPTTAEQPGDAPAPDAPTAQALIAEGKTAYDAGDYAAAAAAFEKSLQIEETPAGQYWLAMALDLQGHSGKAVEAFTQLFANPGHTELGEELLGPAKQRLELLSKIPATVVLTISPANALVEVDSAVQAGGSPHTLKLVAGKHALRISADGFQPLETELDVTPAQSLEQTVELSATQAPAEPSAEPVAAETAPAEVTPAEPRSAVPAYVTLGVAGVSAVLGTVFGLQALSAKKDFEDKEAPTAADADDVERNALIADMAWGIALTLGITGVVLLTSDEPSEDVAKVEKKPAPGSLQVAPYVTFDGGGARARLTF